MAIKLKRVYESPDPGDGYRVLVERLWPRGMSKERAKVDLWLKDAGASPGFERGMVMIRKSGKNSAGNILRKYERGLRSLKSSEM